MKKHPLFALALFVALTSPLCRAADPLPAVSDPIEAAKDPDFALQGEYIGTIGEDKVGVQVIALGEGEFEAVLSKGGLPGDGWDGEKPRGSVIGKRAADTSVTFTKDEITGVLKDGRIVVTYAGDAAFSAILDRVERDSPTLGMKAPEGALVLFDGTPETTAKHWEKAVLEGDLLTQGALSSATFSDFKMHLEFRLPWMPQARGQARGNSGLYLTGRYEVQMLDSFGLAGVDDECGGIYKVAAPRQNLSYPPLRWQTYDLSFTSAKFNAAGEKTSPAKLTLEHNGFLIHEDLEIPGPTGGARNKDEKGPGPVFLQDHGNPVRFRNIWVVTQ